jgi:hypothetical protein
MATATAVLTTAASQIGYVESEGNVTKYWRDLISWGKAPSSYQGQPWCAAFVQWCLRKNGMWWSAQYPYYCPSIEASAKAHGMWHSTPRAGDLVLFSFGYNEAVHIGFVEKVLDSSRIQTIEGNTSSGSGGSQTNGGGVYRRIRSRTWGVRGYARPTYSTSTSSASAIPSTGWTRSNVVTFQKMLETSADGIWGPNTDTRALAVRAVANDAVAQTDAQERLTQSIVDVTVDGIVGPGTRAALKTWVVGAQKLLRVSADGIWGPGTDRAFLAFRSQWKGK